jgi:hypothetical protein
VLIVAFQLIGMNLKRFLHPLSLAESGCGATYLLSVKLEQPATDFATAGTDGEQVEELLVLLGRPVRGRRR